MKKILLLFLFSLSFSNGLTCMENEQLTCDLLIACEHNEDTNVISDLINQGADVNGESHNGLQAPFHNTPLHIAITNLNLSTIQTLINHGANVNIHGEELTTPLNLILLGERNESSYEIAEILLKAGAQINLLDPWGDTPLDMSFSQFRWSKTPTEWNHKFVNLLLCNGAEVNMKHLNLYVNKDIKTFTLLWSCTDENVRDKFRTSMKDQNLEPEFQTLINQNITYYVTNRQYGNRFVNRSWPQRKHDTYYSQLPSIN